MGIWINLGDRDINEHDFNVFYQWPSAAIGWENAKASSRALTKIVAGKLIPYENDPLMLDFSTDISIQNIWQARSLHRHYTRSGNNQFCIVICVGLNSSQQAPGI